jgi:hypothetical protein
MLVSLPQQVQRPPPLELPALNGRSLSPDGIQRQRSVSPPLGSTPPAAGDVEQQRRRTLPQPPAQPPAGGEGQQLQRATSPRAASLARPAASAARSDFDLPQQRTPPKQQPPQPQLQQQVPLPAQAQQSHVPVSLSQRLRAPQGFPAGSAVEAPHARTPEARRELAASRDAAAAAVQLGSLPGSPLPAHDTVQPHDRALLAAAAAQVRLLDDFPCPTPSSFPGNEPLESASASWCRGTARAQSSRATCAARAQSSRATCEHPAGVAIAATGIRAVAELHQPARYDAAAGPAAAAAPADSGLLLSRGHTCDRLLMTRWTRLMHRCSAAKACAPLWHEHDMFPTGAAACAALHAGAGWGRRGRRGSHGAACGVRGGGAGGAAAQQPQHAAGALVETM